jgi:hypothetical protein
MSKAKVRDPDLSEEYDFSRGKRGVYHGKVDKDSQVHLVPDQEGQVRKAGVDKSSRKAS